MSTGISTQQQTLKRGEKMNMAQPINVSELLNFSLPPREIRPPTVPRRSRRPATQAWNKERFVNAQYRFVMDPSGDYTVHFADPDIFFQWQDILQVIIPRASTSAAGAASTAYHEGHISCPICLSPPIAPRMTKCGHVFCYPCLLHYLNTSEDKWARCPICFDSVMERQLKCVKWFEVDAPFETSEASFDRIPRNGALLHLRLMERPQITTLALPRSPTWPSDLLSPHQAPFHFLPDVYTHAKFMLATPSYLMSDLTQDLDQLEAERKVLKGTQDDLSVSFLDAAVQKVQLQISKAAALQNPLLEEKMEKARRDLQETLTRHQDRHSLQRGEKSVDAGVPTELISLTSNTTLRVNASRNANRQRRNVNPPPPSTSTYYYYQAASGLPIFLHPLDIKILLSHFNSYSAFPDSIMIRVENFSEGSVNDDLRKRCKYLAHMPESADVVFIEADLQGVVGMQGLRNFEGALKLRVSRRKDKQKREERARVRAEEREKGKALAVVSSSSWEYIPLPEQPIPTASDADFAPLPVREGTPAAAKPTTPVASGTWGTRSFASTLSSPAQGRSRPNVTRTEEAQVNDNDWNLDELWSDLQQRSSGKKRRTQKLVILGGSGGRRQ